MTFVLLRARAISCCSCASSLLAVLCRGLSTHLAAGLQPPEQEQAQQQQEGQPQMQTEPLRRPGSSQQPCGCSSEVELLPGHVPAGMGATSATAEAALDQQPARNLGTMTKFKAREQGEAEPPASAADRPAGPSKCHRPQQKAQASGAAAHPSQHTPLPAASAVPPVEAGGVAPWGSHSGDSSGSGGRKPKRQYLRSGQRGSAAAGAPAAGATPSNALTEGLHACSLHAGGKHESTDGKGCAPVAAPASSSAHTGTLDAGQLSVQGMPARPHRPAPGMAVALERPAGGQHTPAAGRGGAGQHLLRLYGDEPSSSAYLTPVQQAQKQLQVGLRTQ